MESQKIWMDTYPHQESTQLPIERNPGMESKQETIEEITHLEITVVPLERNSH